MDTEQHARPSDRTTRGLGQLHESARWQLVVAFGVLAIGALWRGYRLGAFPGLDPDEVEGALAWFRSHPILWYVYPSGRPHLNPLAPAVLWPFSALASPAAWVVRMPALLAGLALLPVTYVQVRKAFGHRVGLPAALLVASAPFLIAYSRQGWDLAYIPVVTALAVGFAFRRRLSWAVAALALLVLVHPTAAFVMVIVAAPFATDLWNRWADAGNRRQRRIGLVVGCCIAYGAVFLALSAFTSKTPLTVGHVPHLLRLAIARLRDVGLLEQFVSNYWHSLTGGLVYAEFLGSPVSTTGLWPGITLAAGWVLGVRALWRRQRLDELSLLAALPLALLAHYVTLGVPSLLVPLKERYFLWAVVPTCWSLACVLDAVGARLKAPRAPVTAALVISAAWLFSFYGSYLRPFENHGGVSASLDYRAAAFQPKEQVLQIIQTHRQSPMTPATLFVGEGRLQLVLMYLASRDQTLVIKNLGEVHYRTQQSDQEDLFRAFESDTQDVFFVDYAWGELQGDVREIHASAARPVAAVVAPWTAHEIAVASTADGRPLLRVWRLSKN